MRAFLGAEIISVRGGARLGCAFHGERSLLVLITYFNDEFSPLRPAVYLSFVYSFVKASSNMIPSMSPK